MTFENDILVADSDPEAHTEDSIGRIHSLSRRYRSGQSLFIMSASITTELRTNPWSRKRKRVTQENIDSYFPTKKILEVNETQKVEGLILRGPVVNSSAPTSRADRLSARQAEIIPFWDETIKPTKKHNDKDGKRCQQPTARVIDFRTLNSQINATTQNHKGTKRDDLDTHISNDLTAKSRLQSSPEEKATHPSIVDENRTSSILSTTTQSRSREVDVEAMAKEHCPSSLSAVSPGRVHTPYVDGVAISPIVVAMHSLNEAMSSDAPPGFHKNGNAISQQPSTVSAELTESSMVRSIEQSKERPRRLSSEAHFIDIEHVQQRNILNTQAELASAQRSLAEAIHFEVKLADQSHHYTNGEFDDTKSVERHTQNARGSEDLEEKMMARAIVEADKSSCTSAAMDMKIASPVVQDALRIQDTNQTPTRSTRRISMFAQFESPVGTNDSYLGFGSPLTFTPLRPSNDSHANLSNRLDHTIDNIQKYLNESNFDAEQEARKLMDD